MIHTRDILFVNGPCNPHVWESVGGANACCDAEECGCSVPVNRCTICGDYDYGINAEATEVRRLCAEERSFDERRDC